MHKPFICFMGQVICCVLRKMEDSALLMHQTEAPIESTARCWCWFWVWWQNKCQMSCIWIFFMFAVMYTHTNTHTNNTFKMELTLSPLNSLFNRFIVPFFLLRYFRVSVRLHMCDRVTGCGENSMLLSTFLWATHGSRKPPWSGLIFTTEVVGAANHGMNRECKRKQAERYKKNNFSTLSCGVTCLKYKILIMGW